MYPCFPLSGPVSISTLSPLNHIHSAPISLLDYRINVSLFSLVWPSQYLHPVSPKPHPVCLLDGLHAGEDHRVVPHHAPPPRPVLGHVPLGPGSLQAVVLGHEAPAPGSVSWMIGRLPLQPGDHPLDVPLWQVAVVCRVFTQP